LTATVLAAPAEASLASRLEQTAAMSRRSIVALLRQPAMVVPPLIFPLFFVALGTAAFSRATSLPGFPEVDSFLDFAVAGTIVQGLLVGSFTGATALATDIENGFFERLLAAPTWRASILVGRLAGAMAYGGFQALVFLVVLLPFGLTVESGLAGAVVIAAGATLTALAVGALLSAMALRTGSSDAVQGSFPLVFILLFFSSTFFPRQTMDGAYRTVADVNPVSHLVEGFRGLVIDGLGWEAVARTIGIPIAHAAIGMMVASRELRRRVDVS
jgi:ABC-2 type transport system permease protein